MAESYRFFGSAEGDARSYNQLELAEVLSKIFSNGYFTGVGNQLAVIQNTPAAMNVKVETGEGWINGYWYQNDAQKTLIVSTAHLSLPRIDTVVLRLDIVTNRTITAAIIAGTPSASPVAPTLTQTAQIYEIPLANIAVAASASSIVTGNITDRRVAVSSALIEALKVIVNLKAPLASPTFTGTVAGITAAMVGLGSVTNESKSTMFTSPAFTGNIPTGVKSDLTATLPSASWTGSSAPFTKAVTVTGILATDNPLIDIVPSGVYATDQTMLTNWGKIYRAVTSANTITFYATEVPSADIPFIAKVVR